MKIDINNPTETVEYKLKTGSTVTVEYFKGPGRENEIAIITRELLEALFEATGKWKKPND